VRAFFYFELNQKFKIKGPSLAGRTLAFMKVSFRRQATCRLNSLLHPRPSPADAGEGEKQAAADLSAILG
jgi:hypothetical protein